MNPFYKLITFIILSSIVYSNNANAGIKDAARLVDGCNEAISIYNKKQEKKLWAGLTTSNSESLKAGYCIGVLSAYKSFGSIRTVRQSYECGQDSYYGYRNKTCYKNVEVNDCDNETWFEMASIVAKKWSVKDKKHTTSELLTGICDG
jgi:hypothetical protein